MYVCMYVMYVCMYVMYVCMYVCNVCNVMYVCMCDPIIKGLLGFRLDEE